MGQIKNIKLHIVTDIKCKTTNNTAMFCFICLGIIACITILLCIIIFKTPPKSTTQPPECLQDPKYGTHSFLVLENNKCKIHYVEKGDREKPLMIFLHGFPEFWYSWRHQLLHFSTKYWCVVPDMRGYGQSDKPDGINNYTLDLLVNDVKQLIEGLGRSQCILVGHDWGGCIGFAFSAVYPEMVQAYVAINTVHALAMGQAIKNHWRQRLMSWYFYFFQIPYVPETLMNRQDGVQFFTRMFQSGGLTNSSSAGDDVRAYSSAFSDKHSWTCAINYYRAAMRYPAKEVLKKMKLISVPVYNIFGTGDDYISVAAAQGCKNFCSDYRESLLDGVNIGVRCKRTNKSMN